MFHKAFDLPLKEGLRFERRLFHGLFATSDQKEGENACFSPIRAFSLDSVLQGWPHLLRSGNQNLRTSKVSLLIERERYTRPIPSRHFSMKQLPTRSLSQNIVSSYLGLSQSGVAITAHFLAPITPDFGNGQ